jgi:predicted ATP-dependent endonuclease of OLD family
MHINKISIKNYRNFDDFAMEFHQGLNVIVGANNSGKTGLLYAVRLLVEPTATPHDFNKNNLLQYATKYIADAPEIVIEYAISHRINENDTDDESIIKLISFLGMEEIRQTRADNSNGDSYELIANVRARYSLDPKKTEEYKNAVKLVADYNGYFSLLETFDAYYSWSYTNGISETDIEKKEATGIFDVRFIAAERTHEEVNKETRREMDAFSKSQNNADEVRNFKQRVTTDMQTVFGPALQKVSDLFINENNEIGLSKGNVSISPGLRPALSLSDSYITDVKDTKSGAILPLEYNGLGYNNLINIYMLIKLNEIRNGKDFKILCLEEPEAHLHPAMQYKLFKYLSGLDANGKLNQQIFVTTHSSNISAVAGLDNMFMLAYERTNDSSGCRQQSLETHFSAKPEAKSHLAKFLDATRSDMLFADKVIFGGGDFRKIVVTCVYGKVRLPL